MLGLTNRRLLIGITLYLAVLGWALTTGGVVQGADLTVTKSDDTDDGVCDTDCSLREAIGGAAFGDTIILPAGTYTLTLGTELFIDKDLSLVGAGAATTVVQAATVPGVGGSRVFKIAAGNVEISGVSIRHGVAGDDGGFTNEGGGIHNNGTLTLTDSTVVRNSASDGAFQTFGAGIFNEGRLTLTRSIIQHNIAEGSSLGHGGGIYNAGLMTLVDSKVRKNYAVGGVLNEGGGIFNVGTLTLVNTAINNNTADSFGGGIMNFGILSINESMVSKNLASVTGGGIDNAGGSLDIVNSTINNNTASFFGGGIDSLGDRLTLTNSTVTNNRAKNGGGISNMGISATTTNILTLTNTTVSQNKASAKGGGIFNFCNLFVVPCTNAELVNTIIAGNAGSSGPDCFAGNPIISRGYNLVENVAGCGFIPTTGDVVGVDPLLGRLRDNGGPTLTRALHAGSPAVDAIPAAECNDMDGNPVTTDQRGVVRPQGADCDIGAFEVR